MRRWRTAGHGLRLTVGLVVVGVLGTQLCIGPAISDAQTISATALTRAENELPNAPGYLFAGRMDGGQAVASPAPDQESQVSLAKSPVRIVRDEVHAVTSPARIRRQDMRWMIPLAGAVAVSFATDTTTMRDVVSQNPSFNGPSVTASDVLRDTFIGVPAALFVVGQFGHDDRSREAGILGGEAMLDAYLLGGVLKFATYRERPNVDNARGSFYQTSAGTDSSFPSGHALVSWSSAAVLAGEYNLPWEQATIYTAATGVSLTRVLGRQHFPSDVVVGSAVGWVIGHYVYRAHHRRPEQSLFRRH